MPNRNQFNSKKNEIKHIPPTITEKTTKPVGENLQSKSSSYYPDKKMRHHQFNALK